MRAIPHILCFGAAMPRFVGKFIIEVLCVHELIYVIWVPKYDLSSVNDVDRLGLDTKYGWRGLGKPVLNAAPINWRHRKRCGGCWLIDGGFFWISLLSGR